MTRFQGKLRYLGLVAVNGLSLAALQFVPATLARRGRAVEDDVIVLISILAIGVQVGQTIGMQNHLFSAPVRSLRHAAVVIAAASGASITLFHNSSIRAAGAAAFGAAFGYWTLTEAIHLLLPGHRTSFQAFFARRNLAWLGVTSILALADLLRPWSAVLAAASVWSIGPVAGLVGLREVDSRVQLRSRIKRNELNGIVLALSVGLIASLLYRNDVSIIRGAFVGDERFVLVHGWLIGHGLAVAAVGLVISQAFYPWFRSRPDQLERARLRLRLAAIVWLGSVLSLALGLAVSRGVGGVPLTHVLLLASFAALASPLLSALLHMEHASVVVYATGAASFLGLAGAVRLGVPPSWAFLGYNLALGASLIWLEGRLWTTDPQSRQQ